MLVGKKTKNKKTLCMQNIETVQAVCSVEFIGLAVTPFKIRKTLF